MGQAPMRGQYERPAWGYNAGVGGPQALPTGQSQLAAALAQAPLRTASGAFSPVGIGAAQPAQMPMQWPGGSQLPNIMGDIRALREEQQKRWAQQAQAQPQTQGPIDTSKYQGNPNALAAEVASRMRYGMTGNR